MGFLTRFTALLVATVAILSISPSAHAEPKQPLLADRSQSYAFPMGPSQAIVLGGTSLPVDSNGGQTPATTVELYDYQKGSQRLTDTPFIVLNAVQLTDGTVLICSGGVNPPKCAVYRQSSNVWQAFDAPTDLGFDPFLVPIRSGSALLGGGHTRVSLYSYAAYVLNPTSLTWTRVADTTGTWSGQTGLMISDGRAVLLNGTAFEIFDPTTNTWSAGPPIPFGTFFRIVTLPGDRVLTLGTNYQLYDAAANQWTVLGTAPSSLLVSLESLDSSITVLPNGQVLIAGGTNQRIDSTVVVQSTILLDPATGVTRAAASLNIPRAGHAAVVVADGTALLIGGIVQPPFPGPEVLTKSVESFPWEPSFSGALDPGFYVVTATQRADSAGGLWTIAVNSSGALDGGLNVGGFLLSPNGGFGFGTGFLSTEEVGFGAFYISESQTISANLDLQPPQPCNCTLFADLRILDNNRQIVAGPVSGDAHIQLSKTLQPGFYIAEVHPDPMRTSADFALAVSGSEFQAGGFGGGLISRYSGPGFLSFYLPTRQNVSIDLLNQNTIGYPRGAGELTMTLKDSSGNTLFQSGPGVMNATNRNERGLKPATTLPSRPKM